MSKEATVTQSELSNAFNDISAYIDFGPHDGNIEELTRVRDLVQSWMKRIPRINFTSETGEMKCRCSCGALSEFNATVSKCSCGKVNEFSGEELAKARETFEIQKEFLSLNK